MRESGIVRIWERVEKKREIWSELNLLPWLRQRKKSRDIQWENQVLTEGKK